MTISLQRSNPVMYFVLLALAIVVLYSVSQHALEKHGPIAITVYDTCQRNSLGSWRNPRDKHIANVCQLEDGSWAVRFDWIQDGIRKNTAYVKENIKDMAGMQEYLRRNGYTKWIGIGIFE